MSTSTSSTPKQTHHQSSPAGASFTSATASSSSTSPAPFSPAAALRRTPIVDSTPAKQQLRAYAAAIAAGHSPRGPGRRAGYDGTAEADENEHAASTYASGIASLQSPAKIGSSPAKGRGISFLFPPSPEAKLDRPRHLELAAAAGPSSQDPNRTQALPSGPTQDILTQARQRNALRPSPSTMSLSGMSGGSVRHGSSTSASASAARANKPQRGKAVHHETFKARSDGQKRFDMSDWQDDLAAIASDPVRPPSAASCYSATTPTSAHFSTRSGIPLASSSRCSGAAGPPKNPSIPSLAHKQSSKALRHTRSTLALTTVAAPHTAPQPLRHQTHHHRQVKVHPSSRLPIPRSSHQSFASLAAAAAAAGASEDAETENRAQPHHGGMSPRTAHLRRTVRPLSTRTIRQHHPHQQHRSNASLSASQSSQEDADMDDTATSFDRCATAIRHRQRTLSISESEGFRTDDDEMEQPLDSPDLLGETPDSSMAAEDASAKYEGGSQHDLQDAEAQEMSSDDRSDPMRANSPSLSASKSRPNFDAMERSPFLDTPGCQRGGSLPFHESLGKLKDSQSSHNPYPPSLLKPSRISYPPKSLHFDSAAAERAGRDPLFSSVPASTSSKPVDQLFLASILHSASSQGLSKVVANSSASLPSSSSGTDQASSSLAKPSASLRSMKGLQPLTISTANIPSHIGRKRNLNGAMIGASGPTRHHKRPSSGSNDLLGPDSQAPSPITRLTRPGRSSQDGLTDEEETVSSGIPPLTDSSSITSSLASSQRSRSDGAKDNAATANPDDSMISEPEQSFSTTNSSQDIHDIGYGHIRRTSSTNQKLFAAATADRPTYKPSPPISHDGKAHLHEKQQKSPQFRNVRPLQAAFMNAGLVSKKGRSRQDRDSGVGLGGTPPVWKRLLGPAGKEMMGDSSQGSPAVSLADSSFCSNISSFGSPIPTVEIAGAPLPAGEPHMPDTPCKRPLFAHSRLPTASNQLHPLAQSSRPVPTRSNSSASSTSDVSSVVNSIPGTAIKSRVYGSKTQELASPHTTTTSSGEDENIPHSLPDTTTAAPAGRSSKKPSIQLKRVGPALFRRRSSGQLHTAADGSFLSVSDRSGGSPRDGVQDWEPMTPTRTISGAHLLIVPPLAVSPSLQTGRSTSSSPEEAINLAMISPTSPSYAIAPYLASRYLNSERTQPASLPRPGVAPTSVRSLQRPPFRLRHSSSGVQSAAPRQLMSPDRFANDFAVSRTIGAGEFSEAFEVQDRRTGEVFAVKKTKVPYGGPKERLRRLEEVDILRLLANATPPSEHILHLCDAWEQSGNLYIQTELCSFGNLASFLEEYGRLYELLDETRVWKILSELSAGVAHIHYHGVLHLDLKPANIFITGRGGLKIGDFGLASRWPRASPVTILQGAAVQPPGWDENASPEVWSLSRSRSRISDASVNPSTDLEREGDREYIAPEILRGQYGKEADMFSLGLVILEAAANVILPDNGLPWQKLRENDLSDVQLSHLSDELVKVIVGLLASDPAARMTIDELERHPVVAKIQALRARGLELERDSDGMEVETGSDALSFAKGAVVEEDPSFIEKVFEEVRHAWHSPRRHRTSPRPSAADAAAAATEMEVDVP